MIVLAHGPAHSEVAMAKSRNLKNLRWLLVAAALLAWSFQTGAQTQSAPRATEAARTSDRQIPAGVILPVRLNTSFSSANARPGQVITGRIMQDVPLPRGGKIPEGSKVIGSIVASTPGRKNGSASVSFRFNQLEIHHGRSDIVTDLRAMAGFMEVASAQLPEFTTGYGTPYRWADTQLIGGGEKYGVGGPVTDENSQTVGKGVDGGVLVHVSAQPGSSCRGSLNGDDQLQALWVFSASACGVYGLDGITISHAGRSDPLGVVVLQKSNGEVNLRSATGMLLRVVQ
jgi:hypothetical protein